MKNKKFIALLAMTVALSGVMTACSFGGGKEDSVVVESTPTPTPAKKAKVTPTVAADAQNTTYTSKDKSVAIKLPDATWANKSDETDMVSFESPDQDPDPSRLRCRSGICSDPELPGYGSFHDTGREHGKWNRF